MRGEYWLIAFLLLAGAATAAQLNTSSYTVGQNFTIEGHQYIVAGTYENATYLQTGGSGKIYNTGQCVSYTDAKFCVSDATNLSTAITFYSILHNVTLSVNGPTSLSLGERYHYTITVKSTLAKDVAIGVRVDNPHTITRTSGLSSNLTWNGTLRPLGSISLSFDAIADKSGQRNTTVYLTGPYPDNATTDMTVADYVTAAATYTNPAVTNATYNFTLTLTQDKTTPMNTTVVVTVPPHVRVDEAPSFYVANDTLTADTTMNQTAKFNFTYHVDGAISTPIAVVVDTTRNGTDMTRTFDYNLSEAAFSPLTIIQGNNNTMLAVNQSVTLPMQVYNPNNRTVSASLTVTGALLTLTKKLSIAPHNLTTVDLPVQANVSGSSYLLQVQLSYTDPNNAPVVQTTGIHLHSVSSLPPANATPSNTTSIPAAPAPQATLTVGANATTHITGVNATNASVVLTDNGSQLVERTVNLTGDDTLTLPAQGPGHYVLTVGYANTSVTAERTVQPSSAPAPTTTPHSSSGVPFIPIGIGVIIVAIISWFVLRPYLAKRQVKRLAEQVASEEASLGSDMQFLATFYPASNEDYRLVQELQQEMPQRQQRLEELRAELNRKR